MMTPESPRLVSNDHSQSALTSLRVSVDSVAPDSAAVGRINRRRHHGRRKAAQCVVIASLALFVIGAVMTMASFGPLLYPPGHPEIIFQVIMPFNRLTR